MWGEDSFNMRLRKPKYFYTIQNGVKQISLGKRHGIALSYKNELFGWGDGTYGELGINEDLPIEFPI